MKYPLVSSLALVLSIACSGPESTSPDAASPVDTAADAAADTTLDLTTEVTPELVAEIISDVDVVEGEPVTLVTAGASEHVIVLPEAPSPSQVQAAEDLRSHVEACTGISLEILEGAPEDTVPMIVLGVGPIAESLGVEPAAEALGEQGFALRTVPPHVVIAGTPEAGPLVGVHPFLEDALGVRWYAPGVTKTPAQTDVIVPPMDRMERPAFFWRHTSYEWPGGDETFWTRQGDNNGWTDPESPLGLKHRVVGSAHSYHDFVHPDVYFDEHPEYFSEIGGVRVRDETQLCLTNPDVLDIVAAGMIQRMTDQPAGHQYRFSQEDYYNYCTCDACSAMNAQYETTGGTQFWFTNELAKKTAEVHPDKLVATLAYMYTEAPPVGLEMHPNASVWLCHMYPSCDSHPIATCPEDASYKGRAEAWSTLTDHLYIWHYVVNFTHYFNPFPNLRAMHADMQFYRDIGVEGVYQQGMGHSGGGGEFSLLRPWYGMKLLWNPDQDPDALRRDFLQGYYGPAWEAIDAWVELIHDKVTDDDIHMHLYTHPGQGYLTDEIVEAGLALFDEAAALVAGDATLEDRVAVARMPMTYARLFPRNGYEIIGDSLTFIGELAPIAEVQEFLGMMASHGFNAWMECAGAPDNLARIYSMFAMDHVRQGIDNDLLRVEVGPNLGGRALRILHKESGGCVTTYNRIQTLFFPFSGGLEDRAGEGFRFYGWVEPAAISDHDALSITTTQQTLDGMTIQRTLTLEADAPVLHVTSRLINPKGDPVDARLRTHLELDLGPLAQTTVSFTDLGGDAISHDMTSVIAGLREGRHYYDQLTPAGEWTFSGTDGLDVTWRFDNDEVDFTWLYAYPETLQTLEIEVWAPRALLDTGDEVVLHHEIEVTPSP